MQYDGVLMDELLFLALFLAIIYYVDAPTN